MDNNYQKSNNLIFFIFYLILFLIIILYNDNCSNMFSRILNETFDNNLKFNNTQVWDNEFKPNFSKDFDKNILKEIDDIKPFKNDSNECKKEIKYLIDLQNSRTKKDEENLIKEYDDDYIYDLFELELEEKSIIHWFLNKDVDDIITYLKNKYNRARPSFVEKKIKPCIKVPGYPSYPAAGAIEAHLIKLILSEIHPEKKKNYEEITKKICKKREIGGLNFPSDISYGQKVAEKIFELLAKGDKNPLLKLNPHKSTEDYIKNKLKKK